MVWAVEAKHAQPDLTYDMADGSRVPHIGEKAFTAFTDQGHIRQIVAGVTDVDDALLSVSKVVKAGNRIVLDQSGSDKEHKQSGEVTPLNEKRGLYMLKMWVPNDQPHPF